MFHPLIKAWFSESYGKPTPVQEEAWPLIERGEHVLAIAPTGSGKTLTGFLAAISRFAEGVYETSKLSVLYVSPLKALNEDIRRNLILPLEGIKAYFEKEGLPFPSIRVDTRSGDTPQSERRRFLSLPPSILALTPESLGILLLNPRGRQVLSSVRYVILDEIHAAFGSKRGCFLSCQIDRLALAAGEFQRIALSATVKNPELTADFTGGLQKCNSVYKKRKVCIVSPEHKKELQFQVIYPDNSEKGEEKKEKREDEDLAGRYGRRYRELIKFIIERIKTRKGDGSLLVFTDSRRRAEKISYFLNRTAEAEQADQDRFDPAGNPGQTKTPLAYVHHGSLSKEVRREVEKALACGEIPCVVATGSLELGIDIGSVDEVILAGSPGTAAVALQRVGRSGHGVGQTSRGWLLPFHGMDLLQAAAISGAVQEREIEESESIENPLDILSQIILALICEKDRHEDELYETIRGFYVYRNLSRGNFDSVLRMLAGAYEKTRLRELKRRIFRDDETKILSAAPGLLPLLYTSGGVITSKGYYSLRLAADGTKIGELDEEFVWERRLGDCFDFGNRSWRITAIKDEAVEVIPLASGADSVPFWKGETVYRSPVISRRILEILDGYYPKGWTSLKAEKMLDNFSAEAKKALEQFLHSQWSVQNGVPMAGPSFIPVEIIDDQEGRADAYLIVFHSFRGGGVNYPLALALSREIEVRFSLRVEGAGDDNAVFIRLPRSIAVTGSGPASIIQESLLRLCETGKGEERFRQRLESSGIFGAAFREAAERSLVLPRSPFGKRMPLWLTREKSRRLFDAVSSYRDFPVSAEAWRTCLKEQFDMEGFNALLEDIGSGALILDFFKTRRNSPFSMELSWTETNTLMYQYDERPDLLGPPSQNAELPSLSDKVIAEALGNAAIRPALKPELVEDFCSRLRREIPGWAPEDVLTLCEWVKERVVIPSNGIDDEWEKLLKCLPSDLSEALQEDKNSLPLTTLTNTNGEEKKISIVIHRELAKKFNEIDRAKFAEEFLGQWLCYQGPVSLSRICDVFGLSQEEAETALSFLCEQGELIRDVCVGSETDLVCDRENLELLLRLGRRKQRPQVKERPTRVLVPFLARRQGLLKTAENKAANMAPWRKLTGFVAPAKLWETEFFPSRVPDYNGEMLDKEISEGRLVWYGAGKEKTAFCIPNDLDLVLPVTQAPFSQGAAGSALPADFFDIPRSFWEIKDALLSTGKTGNPAGLDDYARALWNEVWRGSLSSDSWEPLRRALENGFGGGDLSKPDEKPALAGTRRIPRAIRERWRAGPPVRGNWFSLAGDLLPAEGLSLLEEDELNRDRVRLLLDRWGILTRPLLEREAQVFDWARLLSIIRRMELAGELVTGRFFSGIDSLQFASPRIAEELEEAEDERRIFWMNAADPASLAGLVNEIAVRRIPSTRLCFRGADLIVVSNCGARDLEIFIPPDDPDICEALAFIKIARTRKVQPENKIIIEKINGKTAASSGYFPVLDEFGFVKDRGRMILW